MKKLVLIAGVALALAACGGKSGETRHNVDEPDVVQNVDECPRADGQPCR